MQNMLKILKNVFTRFLQVVFEYQVGVVKEPRTNVEKLKLIFIPSSGIVKTLFSGDF